MRSIDTIIFDIGNVLIPWDPKNLYSKIIADEDELNWFCSNVVTLEWHTHHDAGRSMDDGIKILTAQFPQYTDEIAAFQTRWPETIGKPIDGMLDIIQRLKAEDIEIFAITNYSAEKYPEFERDFPFAEHFTDVVVSGREGIVKPSPAIYELAINRFNITPERTLFIDDRDENITAAAKFGIKGHLFSDYQNLLDNLKSLDLL